MRKNTSTRVLAPRRAVTALAATFALTGILLAACSTDDGSDSDDLNHPAGGSAPGGASGTGAANAGAPSGGGVAGAIGTTAGRAASASGSGGAAPNVAGSSSTLGGAGVSANGGSGGRGSGGRGSGGRASGSSGSGGGIAGSSSGGSSSTAGKAGSSGSGGSSGACTADLDCKLAVLPSTGDPEQDCVNRINQFRAECACLPALARWTEGEACADEHAEYDSTREAHSGFSDDICSNGGSAQNECPGWGSTAQVVSGCLQQMWSEGPPPQTPCEGDCFQEHGHFINMTNTRYTKVACGFFTTSGGKIWAVQNFSR